MAIYKVRENAESYGHAVGIILVGYLFNAFSFLFI